jgi:tight adherence protein C
VILPAGVSAPVLAFAAAALACAGLAELTAGHRGRSGASTTPNRPRWRRRAPGSAGLAAVRLLAAAGRALRPLARAGAPGDLERRIAAAGRPGGLGPRELMAAKLTAALAGGAWGATAGAAAPGRLGLATALAGPVAGFLAPDLWLRRRAAERFSLARRELPPLLDLLRVSIQAGMPAAAAMGAVGARSSGPVAAEWRAAAREVELGVPLRHALAGVAARLPLPEVEALCGALARASRHGTPLAEALAAQARDVREAERRRMQEQAARAAPKIQLVVALLLVPSVLLLVAAALAGALLKSDGSLVVGG